MINFITYGDENYYNSKKILTESAKKTNWFNTINSCQSSTKKLFLENKIVINTKQIIIEFFFIFGNFKKKLLVGYYIKK